MAVVKRYYYKIYTNSGSYITTWAKDVISDPSFRSVANGGAGELKVVLARSYDSFNEGIDVSLGNKVELWVADSDNLLNNTTADTLWDTGVWDTNVWDSYIKSFRNIYTGYISAYSPVLDAEVQRVEVTVLGFASEASYRIHTDSSGNTTVAYVNQDLGTIMQDIINQYRNNGGTYLSYVGSSVTMVGATASYTFTNNTIKECFDKIVELCPSGYYWYVSPTGVVYLKRSVTTQVDHQVTIGKDISVLSVNKRLENMANRVYVIGGGQPSLFNVYSRASSISTYGLFEKKIQDGKVTDDATADLLARRFLDRNDSPELRTVLKINDNNGENVLLGLDIESFSVGDTIQIKNFKYGSKGVTLWDQSYWDTDVWDSTLSYTAADVLTIVSLLYTPDHIEIEATSRLPELSKRVEEVNQKVDVLYQTNLPSSPSPRTV